jgi:O-antigen ligase
MKNPTFLIVCVLVAVSPLMRGAVHPWAQTVIQILVALGGIVLGVAAMRSKGPKKWSSREGDRFRQLFWYVAAPCAALGIWSAVMSPHPARAVQGIVMLYTYLGFFFLVVMSVRTRKDERALVWVIVGTAGFLCVVGLLKRFDILVLPWWDYAAETGNAYRDSLTGVYVNRNHMAGFLEMAIPMMLILFITRSRPLEARIIMVLAAVFLVVCQALTLSRGGWAGTAGALAFMAAALLFKRGFAHKRLVGGLLAGAVMTGAIVLAVTPVVDRAVTLTGGGIEENIAHRLNVWKGVRLMIADNPAAGTGPGTFEVAYPRYQQPGYPILVIYAHNDILQFASDTGVLFFPLMLWLLFLFFRAGFAKFRSPSRQTSGIALGCMAAVVAILIHSYSDGNLHIPANALLFTALTALISGTSDTSTNGVRPALL